MQHLWKTVFDPWGAEHAQEEGPFGIGEDQVFSLRQGVGQPILLPEACEREAPGLPP